MPIAAQFERLCKLYPHITRQDLFNDLLLLGLAQRKPTTRLDHYALQSGRSDQARQHICLVSGPFAEFRGLVFKNHTAIDHKFPIGESEEETQVDIYALDDRGS